MSHTVYEHINKINGKKYIGVTGRKVTRRWGADGIGYKGNQYFWNAIQEYGWDNFEHNIIAQNLSKKEAYDLERLLIFMNKSNCHRYGYNISPGGEHSEMSKEARARMSEKNRGKNNPNYGNHKLAGANNPNYGKTVNEEVRQKMSRNRKGKGLHCFSEEHKRKISEHHGGGAEPKKVICVETGAIYKSINDAARALGCSKKMISNCCRKIEHYNTAKGYHWEFCC